MPRKKSINKRAYFELLAQRCKLSEKTIRKVHEQMFLLLAEELRFNGEVDIPRICKITTKLMGGKDKKMFNGDYAYVEEYLGIRIKPKNDLIDFVNGRAVTKESKRYVRKGIKRKVDIQRENLKYEDKERNLDNILNQVIEAKEK